MVSNIHLVFVLEKLITWERLLESAIGLERRPLHVFAIQGFEHVPKTIFCAVQGMELSTDILLYCHAER